MMRHVLAHNGGHEQSIVDHLATLPRAGGTVYLVDVDLTAIRIVDADPELDDLTEKYARFHAMRGNDPRIGLRLSHLLRAAGLEVASFTGRYSIIDAPSGMRPIEVFGRYAGYTAMLPTMAGAANRCVIPEYKFDIERLTELLVNDRAKNPSRYSTVLVSEGAMFEGGEMIFEGETADAYGHKKLGGIGDIVSDKVKELSKKFNKGKTIEVVNQKLGYLARCGDPDVVDSIVPMAYGNIALELLLKGVHGRLVVLHNGSYGNIPIETITSTKKVVDIKEHYNTERLRPQFSSFEAKPLFLMGS